MRGQGRIFKRGTTVWISYCVHGREHRESSHSEDVKAAEKLLQARLREKAADELGLQQFTEPASKKITVHDLLESLKSDLALRGKASPQNLSTLKRADESFGHFLALGLTPKHVSDFIESKLAEEYKPASINRITGCVRQAFELAVREGRVSRAPYIKQLSEAGNARQGFCSAAQFARVRENLPADLRDFAQFAFSTGWRRGEIAGLDWSNVQDGDSVIRLRPEQAKNGHGRSVPVVGELRGIIARRRAARQLEATSLVFHREGRAVFEFRKAWASACRKAGCAGLLFHDLRRSAVSAMVAAHVPQLVAMGISGHRTASMFGRYCIVPEQEQRDAMAAMEAYHAAQTAKHAAQGNVRAMAASK